MISISEIAEKTRKGIVFTDGDIQDMGHGLARELIECREPLDVKIIAEYMIHTTCIEVVRRVVREVGKILIEYENEER